MQKLKIVIGAKSKEIIRESASVNCTGHLSSSLQTDFIIAVNKHKKKIN